MKRPKSYVPKYSLSIYYLEMIMTKAELKALLKKYVEAKINNWRKDIKGKM
jgi:hypothetical protein